MKLRTDSNSDIVAPQDWEDAVDASHGETLRDAFVVVGDEAVLPPQAFGEESDEEENEFVDYEEDVVLLDGERDRRGPRPPERNSRGEIMLVDFSGEQ